MLHITDTVLNLKNVSRVETHIYRSQTEGRERTPFPENECAQVQQIKQVANVLWSSRSMTVPTATLLIQYLRLQNKLPVKRRLPPLQDQPSVRHKVCGALRRVTYRAKSFHNSALQSLTGENPASWIQIDDGGIPSKSWRTRHVTSETNYSVMLENICAVYWKYSVLILKPKIQTAFHFFLTFSVRALHSESSATI